MTRPPAGRPARIGPALLALGLLLAGGAVLLRGAGQHRPPAAASGKPLQQDLALSITPGMSREAIEHALGPPDLTRTGVAPPKWAGWPGATQEWWGYRCRDGLLVVKFERGRVNSYATGM